MFRLPSISFFLKKVPALAITFFLLLGNGVLEYCETSIYSEYSLDQIELLDSKSSFRNGELTYFFTDRIEHFYKADLSFLANVRYLPFRENIASSITHRLQQLKFSAQKKWISTYLFLYSSPLPFLRS